MNHYKFHAFTSNKCRDTKVVIFGLILLILISGCIEKNNGVNQNDAIQTPNNTPLSNVSLLSNETITNTTMPIVVIYIDSNIYKKLSLMINNTNINTIIENLKFKYKYVYNQYHTDEHSATDIGIILPEKSQIIVDTENRLNELEPLIPKKGLECDKLFDSNEKDRIICLNEYDNLVKEYKTTYNNYIYLLTISYRIQNESGITNNNTNISFENEEVRLTYPIINVTDSNILLIITSTLNNTDKNVVKYISLINVLSEKEVFSICGYKTAGCEIPKYNSDSTLSDSKIYLSDLRTYYYEDVCNTFQNTLQHEIGHVVYQYNIGKNGTEPELFAEYYANLRSPVRRNTECLMYKFDKKRLYQLLIIPNQTIDEMNGVLQEKSKECDKYLYNGDKLVVCEGEYNKIYNNISREYIYLIETNLKREYIGLFYNET